MAVIAVSAESGSATCIIVDCVEREVEISETAESIVCVGVGALRYSCYMGAANLVVGVEDYETKPGIPVVMVPGSDTTLDEKAYVTIRILGEVYHMEDRAAELTAYTPFYMYAGKAHMPPGYGIFWNNPASTPPQNIDKYFEKS